MCRCYLRGIYDTLSLSDYRTTSFYGINAPANVSDPETQASVGKMERFDASPQVFVMIAHDASMLDILALSLGKLPIGIVQARR